jgi:hypothetical protein
VELPVPERKDTAVLQDCPVTATPWSPIYYHCCQIPPGLLGQFSQKIRPLEKKLGRKPATPQITGKSAVKNFVTNFWANFGQLLLKLGRKLGNLELGRLLGR